MTVVDHFRSVLTIIMITLMAFNVGSWYCVTGVKVVCMVQIYLEEFNKYYSFIRILITSLFRILYIKKDHWVKHGIGEKNLVRTMTSQE